MTMPFRTLGGALFAGLLSLQLSLSGLSLACAMDDHGDMASMAGMEMAGMDMPGMPTGDAPCDHPASPRDCLSMAPCGVSFVLTEAPVQGALADHVVAAMALNSAAPPSVSFRPDPPPPRA
jgi:hypothetical protein